MRTNFFFYGTLMGSEGCSHTLDGLARPIGPGRAAGALYGVGWGSFPAMVDGAGVVVGEVWEALDEAYVPEILRKLDYIESYDPFQPDGSLYLRERRHLLEPKLVAWTYIWNDSAMGLTPIPSGDWRRWRRECDDDYRATVTL